MEKIINTTTKECTVDSTLWFVLGEDSSVGAPAKVLSDDTRVGAPAKECVELFVLGEDSSVGAPAKECVELFVLGEDSSVGAPAKECGDISKLWCMNTEKSQWPII